MINGFLIALFLGEAYFISFVIGYFLLNKKTDYPFFIMLPIYVSLGLAVLSLITFIVSPFVIHGLVIILIGVLFISITVIVKFVQKRHSETRLILKISPVNLISLILFLVSFAYAAISASIVIWPPIGDIIGHGLIVSLLRHVGRTTFTFYPLSSFQITYPLGMHVFVANFAEMTGLFSGEAILVMGALIISLIPPLLFSLTYIITGSYKISIIPFLASFYIHLFGDLTTWVFGYFYNGPYPCLFGFLLSFLTISLTILFRKGTPLTAIYAILVLIQLLLTYPSFVLIIGPISFFLLAGRLIDFIKHINRWIILTLIIAIAIFSVILFPYVFPISQISLHGYRVSTTFFLDPSFIVMIFALAIGSFYLVKQKGIGKEISLYYLCSFVPILLTVASEEIYLLIDFILPNRLIIISWLLASVLVSSSLSSILNSKSPMLSENLTSIIHRFPLTKYIPRRLQQLSLGKKQLVNLSYILLLLLLIVPSAFLQFTFSTAQGLGWYTKTPNFPSDHSASIWISANVPANERILNDLSWSGHYIASYTYKDVIFHYHPHPPEYDEARLIWENETVATNGTLVWGILQRLNIKWVFSSAESYFFNSWLYGGNSTYIEKPISPAEYASYFDSYSFLRLAFSDGDSRVYEVV